MAAAADRAPCSLCLTWLPLQNFEDGSTIRCVDCRKLMKSVYRQAQEQHVKIALRDFLQEQGLEARQHLRNAFHANHVANGGGHRWKKFGITAWINEYTNMMRAQQERLQRQQALRLALVPVPPPPPQPAGPASDSQDDSDW